MTGKSRRAVAWAAVLSLALGGLDTFVRFDAHGFGRFSDAFESFDWLAGKRIVVEGVDGRIGGVAQGIDATGALLVDSDGALLKILSGTILLAEDCKARA